MEMWWFLLKEVSSPLLISAPCPQCGALEGRQIFKKKLIARVSGDVGAALCKELKGGVVEQRLLSWRSQGVHLMDVLLRGCGVEPTEAGATLVKGMGKNAAHRDWTKAPSKMSALLAGRRWSSHGFRFEP